MHIEKRCERIKKLNDIKLKFKRKIYKEIEIIEY